MRTYDKLIATIPARQGAVILRARFGQWQLPPCRVFTAGGLLTQGRSHP
jgi:hypothetical protein